MATENQVDTAATTVYIEDGGGSGGATGMGQDAAQRVRAAAETAAERVPAALTGAQVAVADTARALDELPNQALIIGTSFSIGFGAGLLLSGSNRLLVLLALTPAAAMAMTLLGRDTAGGQSVATAAATSPRRGSATG